MSEKHIVVTGATVYCDKSMTANSPKTAIPLIINSQILVVANGDKTVATTNETTVNNLNFGVCNDPKYSPPSPKPPCLANVVWSKFHKGVTINDNLYFLTEESEAVCNVCSVPGKIKIAFHGQQATPTQESMRQASPYVMASINPLLNIRKVPMVNKGKIESRPLEHFYTVG